jgi:DNA-binding MarR family transcriptional regulator
MTPTRKQSDDVAEVASSIRRSAVRLVRRLRLERNDEALSLFKLSILGVLYRKGPVTATDLATQEHIRPQSLTRLLASLDKRGFVSRQPDGADRRRLLIAITAEGKKALIGDIRKKEAWLAKVMEGVLSPAERELLLQASRLLDRLTEEDSQTGLKARPTPSFV